MVFRTGDNNYAAAKWIVDATAGQGTHTTIATALASASSGDTIAIRPGTYTENPALVAGVNLTAWGSDSSQNGTGNVIINGKCTFSSAGSVTIAGIQLQTNSDNLLAVTGSAASIVNLENCYLNCSNTTGISFTTSNVAAFINIKNCYGNIGTTGITLYSMSSTGFMNIMTSRFNNPGLSTTLSSNSAGTVALDSVVAGFGFGTTSGGVINMMSTRVATALTNTIGLTTAGTGFSTVINSYFNNGSGACISIGSGTTVSVENNELTSGATNVITGAGTCDLGPNSLGNSALINPTSTTSNTLRYAVARSAIQPAVRARKSSTTSSATGDGTAFTMVYDTVELDQGSNYNNGTGTFTAPWAGFYLVSAFVLYNSLGAGHTAGNVQIYVNGTATTGLVSANPANMKDSSSNMTWSGSGIVLLASGDLVTIRTTISNSTKTVGIQGGGVGNACVEIYQLC